MLTYKVASFFIMKTCSFVCPKIDNCICRAIIIVHVSRFHDIIDSFLREQSHDFVSSDTRSIDKHDIRAKMFTFSFWFTVPTLINCLCAHWLKQNNLIGCHVLDFGFAGKSIYGMCVRVCLFNVCVLLLWPACNNDLKLNSIGLLCAIVLPLIWSVFDHHVVKIKEIRLLFNRRITWAKRACRYWPPFQCQSYCPDLGSMFRFSQETVALAKLKR